MSNCSKKSKVDKPPNGKWKRWNSASKDAKFLASILSTPDGVTMSAGQIRRKNKRFQEYKGKSFGQNVLRMRTKLGLNINSHVKGKRNCNKYKMYRFLQLTYSLNTSKPLLTTRAAMTTIVTKMTKMTTMTSSRMTTMRSRSIRTRRWILQCWCNV
jgi:hypothetical protein